MKITDILNRDIINLENCEQEPIHIPGSIQPHGFLLGLTDDQFIIEYASGNCKDYIGVDHAALLGKPFGDVFGAANEGVMKLSVSGNMSTDPFAIVYNELHFQCSVHKANNVFIVEVEPSISTDLLPSTAYKQTRQFLSYMEQTSSLQQLCNSVARGTREITGYDRVMIYRFDEEYNGEIFAEAKRDDLESFLSLHYPHTDIPAQARRLYLRNLLRLIADVDYVPVPIYTRDDSQRTNKDLDLSHSILRSTSPIHVQYLQNMGVGATLTISLIHDNRLWGLIACHHYSAKNISPATRLAAQLQGHFITSQIDVRQSNEEYDVTKAVNEALKDAITETISLKRKAFSQIVANPLLLDLCNASGVCIIVKDCIYKSGLTPDDGAIMAILDGIHGAIKEESFSSSHLSVDVPAAKNLCDSVAGIIYHSLGLTDNNCVMWFRPETVTEVKWGGDPHKAIVKDDNGLHPRKSFEQWQEVVKCKSKPWLRPELTSAANYANALRKHVTFLALEEEERRYKKLSEELKESNDELENINWISTHDLQEPLRKIQLMASRILVDENEEQGNTNLVLKMNESASKMQTLLTGLLNHSKIKNTADATERVNLNQMLTEVVSELSDLEMEKMAKIVIAELPEIDGVPILIRQLFANLLNNALKFTSDENPQVITVWEGDDENAPGMPAEGEFTHIVVADTGIGFDQKHSESIFRIFTRLNSSGSYSGNGMGLALCKKIMQLHKGHIAATSTLGEGAEFHLYFPVLSSR